MGPFEFIGACVLFSITVIWNWFWTACFQMRDLLRVMSANSQTQTELLQTHTRLLAAMANAANPVEPFMQN